MLIKSILDLRFKGRMDPELNSLFNQVSYNLRSQFNALVSEISDPHKNNIDWWVQDLPSRNTYACPFYHYFCCIHFAHNLMVDGNYEFEKIIVDTKEMKKVIKKIIDKHNLNNCQIQVNNNIRKKIKKNFKKLFGNFYILIYNILKWFIAKLSIKSNKQYFAERSLVLIDTFAIPGYTDSKRWYGSLWENLADELKKETYFVSTIPKTSFLNLFSIYNEIRTNEENYLIKEDYIHFTDLLFAFNYKKRLKLLILKKMKILDYDITDIIAECLKNPIDIYTTQESLLTYRFIFRLKQKKVKIRLAIDWFEGQIIDKAWNAGFDAFYPEVKTISYRTIQNFPFNLCSYPIPIEKEAGVISKVFAMQGIGAVKPVKEFMKDLQTIIIPSFKSEHVWTTINRNNNSNSNEVLVTLPISLDVSTAIVSLIIDVCNNKNYIEKSNNFIVKPHPTRTKVEILQNFSASLPDNFIFTDEKSFYKLLANTNLLITEASSTCLEAIACGVPVVVIKRKHGLYDNPLPNDINKCLFKECSTTPELIDALNYYNQLNEKQFQELQLQGRIVRKNYFEPVTKEGTNRLMDLGQMENHIHA